MLRYGSSVRILPCVPVELVLEPAGCHGHRLMGRYGLQTSFRASSP